jgi:hypothetical protein
VMLVWIGLFCGGLAVWTKICEWIADFFDWEVRRG